MKLTLLLIILNVLIFAASLPNLDYYLTSYGFSQHNFLSGGYYTIITAMFLHANLAHLGGNMITLLFLGTALEKKVKAEQYLLAYFAGGIIGNLSLFVPIFSYSHFIVAVGASAAISGLVGLGIFMCPGKSVMFPILVPLPFAIGGAIYFLLTMLDLFAPGYVAYSAHLFGFLAGSGLGFVWSEKRFTRLVIFVVVLILITAISLWLANVF